MWSTTLEGQRGRLVWLITGQRGIKRVLYQSPSPRASRAVSQPQVRVLAALHCSTTLILLLILRGISRDSQLPTMRRVRRRLMLYLCHWLLTLIFLYTASIYTDSNKFG